MEEQFKLDTLILVRHGDAPETRSGPRPLSEKGREQGIHVGEDICLDFNFEEGFPSAIFHTEYVRCVEFAGKIREGMGEKGKNLPLIELEQLREDMMNPQDLRDFFRTLTRACKQKGYRSVVLVCHQPNIVGLLSFLQKSYGYDLSRDLKTIVSEAKIPGCGEIIPIYPKDGRAGYLIYM